MAGNKVLLVHFRIGKTDGVSLEMANWTQILTGLGMQVETMAGVVNEAATYTVEGFENQLDPLVFQLDQEAFGGFKRLTESDFGTQFALHQQKLTSRFKQVLTQAQPDHIIVSNVFSVGENLAAAGALFQAISELQIPTLAIHHDFYWEGIRYKKPSCQLVVNQLEQFFPPQASWLKHACINSLARRELRQRKGISADIVYDTLDFDQPQTDAAGVCGQMLAAYGVTKSDFVVLQATRIVRRKNIELAMDVNKQLMERSSELGGRRVVFVMAGYAEKRDEPYQELLRRYAKHLGLVTVELNGLANQFAQTSGQRCSLLDVYPYADVVTYPSEYEGFGNQLLEAFHAKKPIVGFAYPVFKSDIKPLGLQIISLGDKLTFNPRTGLVTVDPDVITSATTAVIDLVNHPQKLHQWVEANFTLAKENFSFAQTQAFFKRVLLY